MTSYVLPAMNSYVLPASKNFGHAGNCSTEDERRLEQLCLIDDWYNGRPWTWKQLESDLAILDAEPAERAEHARNEPPKPSLGCPQCLDQTDGGCCFLFERPEPNDLRGYHRYVCLTHKLKAQYSERYISMWRHMTDEELASQYDMLDSFAEVEWGDLGY